MKRFYQTVTLALALAPLQVSADDCTAKIAAAFKGGALDAYQRPAHRHEKQVLNAEGEVTFTFLSIVQTPLRTIAGLKGGDMTLSIEDKTWTGQTPDGPWTVSENNMPKDRIAWHLALQAQQAKNLSKTECEESITREGAEYERLHFTTQTDPNPDANNAFFGGTTTAYIDPATQQVMRLEVTGLFSSWLPEPGTDTHITRFSYDPSIVLNTPM